MELKEAVEESLKMSEDELKKTLPSLADGLKGNVRALMDAIPDLPAKLAGKMREIDVAKFASEAPEAAGKFMDILWEAISVIGEKSPDAKAKLQSAGEVKVNFEATDSPMKGHLKISAGKISGGATPIEAADLKISGPTKVMVGMVTGEVDPVRGFMSKQYKMEGSMSIGMKLAPVMTSLAKAVKGA